MFSVVCAAGGAAPLTGLRAHRTFDFNQATHAAFLLVVAPVVGAPRGCCLAMTMEWLHNWRAHPMTAYVTWVGLTGGGHPGVLAHTVAVYAPPGPWSTTTTTVMGGLGFAAHGGLTAGPAGAGIAAALSVLVLGAQSTILIARGALGAHAVGVRRVRDSVFFFDPNHGELFFESAVEFGVWFFASFAPACLVPILGAGAVLTYHTLRYN